VPLGGPEHCRAILGKNPEITIMRHASPDGPRTPLGGFWAETPKRDF